MRIAKASETEPLLTCRNALGDIRTGIGRRSWDKSGGNLFTGPSVSGMKRARARFRLLHGTGEPVVPGAPLLVGGAVGRTPSGRNREEQSTDPGHRGGPSRSSGEAAVMVVERRGRIIRDLLAGQPHGGRSR